MPVIKNIVFWLGNARHGALPHSILPAVLSLCMAYGSGGFSTLLGALALIGVVLGHLGINLLDDYFDYKQKSATVRARLAHRGIRARIGKCNYLVSNEATLRQLLGVIVSLLMLAMLCGAVILFYRGRVIFYIAAAAAIIGASYSGGPLKLSYRGLGGVAILFLFGPLLMSGVYYSAAGSLDVSVIFLSISTGLLVVNAGHVHDIMDYEPDIEVGKMTLAVLLGSRRSMLVALMVILTCIYGSIVAGVIWGYLSLIYLSVLVTLPLAISLFWLMVQFVRDPHREYLPAFWMGPIPKWAIMQEAGVGWFMIRWFLARNLQTAILLILITCSLLAK